MPKNTQREPKHETAHCFGTPCTLDQGIVLLKEKATAKFNESIDIAINLNVNPQKAEQMVRGVVALPHGTGKSPRVLVICTPDKVDEAREAGADHVGLDDYLQKIRQGWTDVDVVVTTPDQMAKLGQLGKVLGPRNLMPNPKAGTVTTNLKQTVEEIKKGRKSFKVDKHGTVHASIGRVSFTAQQLTDNIHEFHATLLRHKPSTVKGNYIESIFISSTMGPSIRIDPNSLTN